ncbi:MAG: type II toxin-antitoxin system VapB family antitoxin [Calditrichaeota bacterium]|nr:type II toxin-antitoxin system VapB family antitoxin [Calditrichota bacterium]
MRTNIVINDNLMRRALELSDKKTKKAVVEEALALLVKMKQQVSIRRLKGRLTWEGDLEAMRRDQ